MSQYLENQIKQINAYMKEINKCLVKIKAFEQARENAYLDDNFQTEMEDITQSVIIDFAIEQEKKK